MAYSPILYWGKPREGSVSLKKQVILRDGRVGTGVPLTKRRAGQAAIVVVGTNGRANKRIIPRGRVIEMKDLPGTQPV